MPEKQVLGDRDVIGALERDGVPVLADEGQVMGTVNHGADANVTRPNITGAVTWIGTVDPVNKVAGDIWINPDGTAGGSTHQTYDTTVDLVDAASFIDLGVAGQDVNAFVVKANATAETGYGRGQAFMVLKEGTGDATDDTAAGSVMFRVDRHGNTGITGGLHVATGLRNDDGQNQAVWIDPSDNMIPLVINNPTVAEAATWDKDYIQVLDSRNANAKVFSVASTGAVLSTRELTARSGDAALQTHIGTVFGFSGLAMGTNDTLIYRAEAAIVAVHNTVQMPERADPAAPGTNAMRLYARDNGAGKTQLCVRFNTGAVQVIATEP